MRILHVVESFAGGTFEVVRILSRLQVADGNRVAIAYRRLPETPAPLRPSIDARVELRQLRWSARRPLPTAVAIRDLRRYGRELQPDVAHLHSAFGGFAGAAALAGATPTVYTPHGHSIAITTGRRVVKRVRAGGERFIASRVDVIGAVSEAEADLQRRYIGGRRLVVIPNGIPELDTPAERERRPGRPLVVSLGRMTTARRPLESGRILSGVRDLADVLWIGGVDHKDGVEVPGLPITGWMPRDQATRKLADATALLHFSAWDSHPLAVLEGMALDVAVVASDIPANRELLGPTQVCVSESDATELLRRVVGSEQAWSAMIENQRRRRQRFSARRMAEQWMTLYESLCG